MAVQMTQSGVNHAMRETKKEWEKLKANSELTGPAFMVSKEATQFLGTFAQIQEMVREQGLTIGELEEGVSVKFVE